MDITYLIDQLHVVDFAGQLKLKVLCLEQYQRLDECILWRTERGQLSLIKNVTFGDAEYKGKGRSDGAISFTGSRLFDYELKSISLLYYKIGHIEGGYGFEWSTTRSMLYPLKKFAWFLSERDYDSFREFDQAHPITQRELINNFLLASNSDNGMDLQSFISSRKAIQDSLPVIHRYGLFSNDTAAIFYDVIDAIPSIEIEDYSTSHPVIPTGILKRVIQQSKERIDEAERLLPEWEEANEDLINKLEVSRPKFAKKLVSNAAQIIRRHVSPEDDFNEKLEGLFKSFRRLRVDVYVQVLVFTGMRNQEVAELENDAAKSRDKRFYIQSILSKTAPGKMTLNW
ncbi:hypothetical protein JCM19232_4219 [Vibrio ishigakensis]|uniref:Uncharacterized protein n=1 Tax=Vibrio ishigakensis TaxID=1481914 RepID=A0A0B8PRG2_9VIBR|nr:hypothetical protein JCM19232_4219 [Vibrio ishigakensis]